MADVAAAPAVACHLKGAHQRASHDDHHADHEGWHVLNQSDASCSDDELIGGDSEDGDADEHSEQGSEQRVNFRLAMEAGLKECMPGYSQAVSRTHPVTRRCAQH